MESYTGDYDSFIDYGPDLFKLLTQILDEKNVSPEIRLKICAALAYFVAPYDIISEQIHGPEGYIDDIFLCAYVLKDIKNDYGFGLLTKHWENSNELEFVIDECFEKTQDILGNAVENIIKYVGLDYFD